MRNQNILNLALLTMQKEISMERTVFPIWTTTKPFTCKDDSLQHEHLVPDQGDNVDRYTDVTEPTLSFFPASGPGSHPAMLVCPGGGYNYLTWNKEGLDIASFLNLNGFTAFVLKYRCPDRKQAAYADTVRAMRFIRAHAEKFGIIPDKLGCIGFSAGAHLCARIAAPDNPFAYEDADEIDKISYRPDFAILIYPAYLADEELKTAPEFKIDEMVPPCFLVQTEDDSAKVECSIGWFKALKRAGVKAEMHIYPDGGHGYGLLRTSDAVSNWGMLAADWLRRQIDL